MRYTIGKDNNGHYRVKLEGRNVGTIHQHNGEVYLKFDEAVPAHGLSKLEHGCKFIFKGQNK